MRVIGYAKSWQKSVRDRVCEERARECERSARGGTVSFGKAADKI